MSYETAGAVTPAFRACDLEVTTTGDAVPVAGHANVPLVCLQRKREFLRPRYIPAEKFALIRGSTANSRPFAAIRVGIRPRSPMKRVG